MVTLDDEPELSLTAVVGSNKGVVLGVSRGLNSTIVGVIESATGTMPITGVPLDTVPPRMAGSIGEFAAHTALAPAPACTMKAELKHAVKRRTRAEEAELRTRPPPFIAITKTPEYAYTQ